jgi:4'-phosphopantetheinyl transferase
MKKNLSAFPPRWSLAPETVTLESGEVHVWRVESDLSAVHIADLGQTLAPDERIRADRYKFQKDHDHFIVARAALREILSRYLHESPGRLRFDYDSFGKPSLAGGNGDELRFNVSHSHEIVLIAVTRGRDIGVDIERIRPDMATFDIAERFFSRLEAEALRALPMDRQAEGFFNGWTRKEAYLKALGKGLSMPLDQFVVSLSPGEPACLLKAEGDPREGSRWSMWDLRAGPDYVAALVVAGQDCRLRCWQW